MGTIQLNIKLQSWFVEENSISKHCNDDSQDEQLSHNSSENSLESLARTQMAVTYYATAASGAIFKRLASI